LIVRVSSVSLESQGPTCAESRSWFKGALGDAPKSEVRALRKGMLFQQIIVSDAQALISPYLYSANTGYSPRLELNESCSVFGTILHEFEELWKLNSPN
jgi:hypothetical protein